MSLLSSIQGTPERVRSLSNLLASLDEPQNSAQLERLLTPSGLVGENNRSVFNATLNVAKDLRLVTSTEDSRYISNAGWMNEDAFADYVHDILCSTDDLNAIVFQSFSYVVLRSNQERGVTWISNASGIADLIDSNLPRHPSTKDGDRQMNSTKMSSLLRWWSYLGLCLDSIPKLYVYPDPSRRLSRIIRFLLGAGIFKVGEPIDPRAFRSEICEIAPYLDIGSISESVQASSGLKLDTTAASWALTVGLEQLVFDSQLEIVTKSDASSGLRLAFSIGAQGVTYVDQIIINEGVME